MKIKKKWLVSSVALYFGLLMAVGSVGAWGNPPSGHPAPGAGSQIEQDWSADDVTGAWEVVLRSYITLPEEDTVPIEQVEEIKQINESLENQRAVERFSDQIYNHFEDEPGGQNSIYDRAADQLFIYNNGEGFAYHFNFVQYQKDFLEIEQDSSEWPVVALSSETQRPIAGFEVKKTKSRAEKNPDSVDEADDTGSVYWVAPELPSWFSKLKGISLPGYPLQRVETVQIDNMKMSIHVEVESIRPIDPEMLLSRPPSELELIPWASLDDDELFMFGITTDEDDKQARVSEQAEEGALAARAEAGNKEKPLSAIASAQMDFLAQLEAMQPRVYDALSPAEGGLARAERQGQSFYLDARGELVFEHPLDTVLASTEFGPQAKDNHSGSSGSSAASSGPLPLGERCVQLHHYDEHVVEHVIVARADKMGLTSGIDGQWLLEPVYDRLEKRSCQMLKTYQGGQQGLATVWGQELVPAEFDEALFFGFEQYFAVKKEDRWGVYDARDKALVIPAQFQAVSYCAGCGLKPAYFYAQQDDQWGLLDFQGEVVLPFKYEFPAHQNMRGDRWVTNLLKDGKRVLIHLDTGEHYFLDGYEDIALLNDFVALKKNGFFALFNGAGQQITDFELSSFHELDKFQGQRAYIEVAKDNKRAVVDDAGALIMPWQQAEHIGRLTEDYFWVHHGPEAKVELRDLNGTVLIPAKYDSYRLETRRDKSGDVVDTQILRITKSDGLRGWYTLDDGVLVEPAFESIFYRESKDNGQPVIEVEKGGLKGIYALDGTQLVPAAYEDLSFLNDNLLSFRQEGRHGLIDLHTGDTLLPARYDRISPFEPDRFLALVLPRERDDEDLPRYHWWDIQEGVLIDLDFKDYEPLTNGGLWQVFEDHQGFLYDLDSQRIISGAYDVVVGLANDLIIVEKDGRFGAINTKGDEVFPFEYDLAVQNSLGFTALSQQNKHGFWQTQYFRPDGTPIFAKPMMTWDSPEHYDLLLVREKNQEIYVRAFDPKQRKDLIGVYGWDGSERLPPQYEALIIHDKEPRYVAVKDSKAGLFDGQGQQVFPTILDDVYYARPSTSWGAIRTQEIDQMLLARIQDKYFYIRAEGEVLPLMADSRLEFE